MKTVLITPPDEHKRRKGRRRYIGYGIAALLPQSALMGSGGLRWLNEVASPHSSARVDLLFQAMLTGVTAVGLPIIAVVCGVHFMRLGGNRLIGTAMILAGPAVSVLATLGGQLT